MGGSTFLGALIGGLIGGKEGMLLGGAIGGAGGIYAAANTKSFKPLHEVLSGMNQEEKMKLVATAKRILRRKGIDLSYQIVGNYGSQFAREFLLAVCEEFSGKNK